MSAEGANSSPSSRPEQFPEPPTARRPRHVAPSLSPTLDSPTAGLAVYCAGLPNTYITSFCGAMSGMASGIVTCPLDVIKTRLQAQGSFRGPGRNGPASGALYHGMLSTARTIWREDGIRGMYRGLGPMLLGYLPTWAVYMAVYDSSRDYYYTKMGSLSLPMSFLICN